jgi:quercetin dioxygenase-like cupin family protein
MHTFPIFARAALAASVSLAGISLAQADEAAAQTIHRQLLMKQALPAPAPNLETKVIRVQFQPGAKTPVHTHEGPGPRYVLKGHLRVEDAGVKQVYGPGDVFWETGAPMTIENVGGSDAEMVIFEMAPAK